ncbi:MAG: IPExxxVDY family protein [Bacteroidales bacterium]
MAKKIHRLKHVEAESYKLICIASHQNDYRVSWAINEKFQINLKRTVDHRIQIPKTDNYQHFLHYVYVDNLSMVSYHLIANKSEYGFLLKNMPNIDYLLKILGHLENISTLEIVRFLKDIPIIMTAFEVDKITPVQHRRLSF